MFNKIGLLAVRFMRWISSVWRNFLGTILGLIVGGNVNLAIVNISTDIIPGPAGADVKTMEGLQKSIHLFEPKHFLMPFLAHALGTLVAALLASLIAKSHRKRIALTTGVVFFVAGAMAVSMLPAPLWFNITDLALAYIPMALLGHWISTKFLPESA
jgi:Na+/citrate or Na+/malate symporter